MRSVSSFAYSATCNHVHHGQGMGDRVCGQSGEQPVPVVLQPAGSWLSGALGTPRPAPAPSLLQGRARRRRAALHWAAAAGRRTGLVVQVDGGGVLQPPRLLDHGAVDLRVAVPHRHCHNAGKRLQQWSRRGGGVQAVGGSSRKAGGSVPWGRAGGQRAQARVPESWPFPSRPSPSSAGIPGRFSKKQKRRTSKYRRPFSSNRYCM